jgi:hypothetical protein
VHDRRAICDWLESTNPSDLHSRTRGLHEEHTGSWVLQTPEWKAWFAGKARSVWIHGIPGAGKTVLASFLIEEIAQYCSFQPKTAAVYYYCYFGHNQDESNALLRWLVSQLCRGSGTALPPELLRVYDRNLSVETSKLLSLLSSVLQSYDSVFLSIDALDESQPRQPLLDVLKTLMTDSRFRKIQLLTTSREYLEIEEVMSKISLSLSMDHALVRKDIGTYVRSILDTSRDFRRWPPVLRNEIEAKLVDGAKGM